MVITDYDNKINEERFVLKISHFTFRKYNVPFVRGYNMAVSALFLCYLVHRRSYPVPPNVSGVFFSISSRCWRLVDIILF